MEIVHGPVDKNARRWFPDCRPGGSADVNEDPACRGVGAPDFQSRPLRV